MKNPRVLFCILLLSAPAGAGPVEVAPEWGPAIGLALPSIAAVLPPDIYEGISKVDFSTERGLEIAGPIAQRLADLDLTPESLKTAPGPLAAAIVGHATQTRARAKEILADHAAGVSEPERLDENARDAEKILIDSNIFLDQDARDELAAWNTEIQKRAAPFREREAMANARRAAMRLVASEPKDGVVAEAPSQPLAAPARKRDPETARRAFQNARQAMEWLRVLEDNDLTSPYGVAVFIHSIDDSTDIGRRRKWTAYHRWNSAWGMFDKQPAKLAGYMKADGADKLLKLLRPFFKDFKDHIRSQPGLKAAWRDDVLASADDVIRYLEEFRSAL